MAIKTLLEACIPRSEVLSGELTDEMFAARLSDVTQGNAHPIYQDPDQFFSNTFPTERVQAFFKEVLGRLSGVDPTAGSMFLLDTPFGGGKTHTLIGLYHLANSNASNDSLSRLGLNRELLPSHKPKIVSIVGDDLDPANGLDKGDVRVHHLWGDIAYQLGGSEGYKLVEQSDVKGQAPGSQFLDKLVGSEPCLILIDEPAVYLRKMGNAADQLPAFLKALGGWVTRPSSRTVLVITLALNPQRAAAAAPQDAFSKETQDLMQTVFSEVGSVISRELKVVTPSERQDIAPILRQRLFQDVDMTVAPEVSQQYFDALTQAQQRGIPVPAETVQAFYRENLKQSYPFHPSLIEVMDGKLATIPNFQKTRGVLRSMARVIRRMWNTQKTDGLLIHPYSLDFADPDLVDELTGRLDRPVFRQVAGYDVATVNGDAHAQVIDKTQFSGHAPYTTQIATTILLHSLPEPPARGVDVDELIAATLTPTTDPAHLQKALEYLIDEAWHLDYIGTRHFFQTEPSLNKIVQDETENVPNHEARTEVARRINQLWRDAGLSVKCFPSEPSDLDDEPRGRLAILHWDTGSFKPGSQAVPDKVKELWEYAGVQRNYRRYRNTLFFLVADTDRQDNMLRQARRFVALDKLTRDTQKQKQYRLSPEHQQRIHQWKNSSDLEARLAITRAYRHLFYPLGDAAEANYRPFGYQALQIEEQGEASNNPTQTVLKVLRDLGQVKSADDNPLAPALVKQYVFGQGEGSVPLQTVFERFAERPRLPILLEPTYLKTVVQHGIGSQWLYLDKGANLAYNSTTDLPDIVIDDKHEIATPEYIRDQSITIYSRTPQPSPDDVGGTDSGTTDSGTTDSGTTEGSGGQPGALQEITVEEEPARALSDLAARAIDTGWAGIASITITWQADGGDAQAKLSSIRTILGQIPQAEVNLEVHLSCEFADGAEWETNFKGPSQRYQQMAATFENQAGDAKNAIATTTLGLVFPSPLAVDGHQYEDLRDTLNLASLGRTRFTARAAGSTN